MGPGRYAVSLIDAGKGDWRQSGEVEETTPGANQSFRGKQEEVSFASLQHRHNLLPLWLRHVGMEAHTIQARRQTGHLATRNLLVRPWTGPNKGLN